MIIRRYHFYVNSGYVNSTREEEVEIEFEDDATEEEIEEIVHEEFDAWLWNNIDSGWTEIK